VSRQAQTLHDDKRMNKKIRWLVSIATGIAAVPTGYAASVMLCGPSPLGSLLVLANALTLIP
jgi:hypothetical protein